MTRSERTSVFVFGDRGEDVGDQSACGDSQSDGIPDQNEVDPLHLQRFEQGCAAVAGPSEPIRPPDDDG